MVTRAGGRRASRARAATVEATKRLVAHRPAEVGFHGTAPRSVDDRDDGYEAPVPCVSPEDRDALLLQVEALPVGTVVERFGVGLARRFGEAGPPDEPDADVPF